MAILMTREEYKKQYGVDPVIPAIQSSQIDTTPAPIRMTRDEYNSLYNQKQPSKLKTFLDKTQNTVAEAQSEGAKKVVEGYYLAQRGDKTKTLKDSVRGRLRLTSGAIDTAFAPLAILLNPAMGLLSKRIDKATDDPNLQRFSVSQAGEKAINTTEDIVDISNIAGLYAGGKSAPKIAGEAGTALREARTAIENKINTSKINADISATNKLADEILNIENSYNKTSIKNTLSKDTGSASRQRIANTDVLTNIVDEDGKITYESAKNAAKAYSAQTIDGAEGVVRDLLKQEGQKINLEEIRKALTSEIYASGLEGADLVTAINGVKRELSGLKLRADELGNVPLETIHDAKISTTRNIDYSKPPEVSYRRSLANIYRKIVEDKSNIKVEIDGKTYGVRDINGELSKYYGDIERIENLGGKRVKGGRLGKYSSQIAGNIAGGAAGGFIGGPLGTAVGTIVGGEVASKLRGKQMASTFGTARGKITPKSAILEGAKEVAKGEKKVDLRIPDKKVGVPKNIPKTKEVQKLEAQIAKNVEAQKKAIKAGDFTLVATLKEIYSALVEQLKAVVKKVIEDTKEYIKNPKIGLSIEDVSKKKPTSSSKAGKPSGTKISESTPSKNSTIKSDTSQAYKGETDLTTKILKDLEGKTTKVEKPAIPAYKGEKDITTKLLKDLEGRTEVSPEYIEQRIVSGDLNLKQVEKDLANEVLDRLSKSDDPLIKEARKYKSADEFVKAFTQDIKRGQYWHITEDPNFKIDLSKGPRDMSSLAGGEIDKGKLMITSDLPYWAENYKGSRKYVAKIDMSNVPNSEFWQTERGMGNEFFVNLPEKAVVEKVIPLEQGLKESMKFKKWLEQNITSKSQLTDIWKKAQGKISVQQFADEMKKELLPLKVKATSGGYENINMSPELRGNIAKYEEHTWESPIKTSAGEKHSGLGGSKNYFGHTRIEDMADNKTRRVIEVQSDLYQKGNLEKELDKKGKLSWQNEELNKKLIEAENKLSYYKKFADETTNGKQKIVSQQKLVDSLNSELGLAKSSKSEVSKLQQYNNPTAHFRMVREEIKKAAEDGKTKLQFPTGETVMKIEGLGSNNPWMAIENGRTLNTSLTSGELKIGKEINDGGSDWIITDVLGDGKFKAVPKQKWDDMDAGVFLYSQEEKRLNELWSKNQTTLTQAEKAERDALFAKADQLKESFQFNREIPDTETFDISGKVDTNNPIYKFYEKDMQKYLNKFGGKRIVDENGVSWIEVPIKKEWAKMPVEAFAILFGVGLASQN